MAFVLTKKRLANNWPVTINVPVDGGNIQEHVCTADFEILTQKEYDEKANEGDVALLNRVVVGLGPDVQHEDGSQITCTDANKSLLFNSAPFVRVGFINAYHDAARGAAVKN